MATKTKKKPDAPASETERWEADNWGPVQHAEFELRYGINVLRGPNGAGKTTVLAGIAQSQNERLDFGLTPRDGAEKGTLKRNGETVMVVRRTDDNGRAEISLEDTSPIADLIEPRLKDPEAAERKRVQSLLKIRTVALTREAVSTLLSGDDDALAFVEEEEPGILKLDVVTAADRIRRAVHKLKRQHEQKAAAAAVQLESYEITKPAQLVDVSIEKADERLQAAMQDLAQYRGEANQRARQERERQEIRATLRERPDVERLRKQAEDGDTAFEAINTRIIELERELAVLRAKCSDIDEARDDAYRDLRDAETQADFWDRRKAILDSPLEGATQEDVQFCEKQVAKAKTLLDQARESARYRESLSKADDARSRSKDAGEAVERFEAVATGVTGRLAVVLESAGLEGVTVDDGVVMVEHSRGTIPFRELSFGEKVDLALTWLDLPPNSTLPLSGEWIGALDPENLRDIDRRFKEKRIRAVTERPDVGELTVEAVA